MDRFRIHGSLHAQPPDARPGPPQAIQGHQVQPLQIGPELRGGPLTLSFEEAAARLARLPRMFLEPDGSFVWVSLADQPAWQLDGVLYDRDGHLQFIDVRGEFTEASLAEFLAAVTSGDEAVMFQLAREAVFLDVVAFKRSCRV